MMDPAARRGRTLERLGVPAVFALALAVRLREAMRVPLWFDESYARAAIDRPWPDVMGIVRADVHPPLHFALAHTWRVFGNGDVAIRSSSIVCALAAMVLAYGLARQLFGRGTALLAMLLVALHPWHVYASQEARSYPLLWLALAGAWWSAWRWCEHGRRGDAVRYALCAALALWTHYLAGVLLAMAAAWGVVRLAREPRRLGAWLLVHLGAAALFAPLVPLLWTQFHRVEAQHWMRPPHLADLADLARRFAFGSTRALVACAALALWPIADRRARRGTWFVLAVGPLAVIACWLLARFDVRVFAFKYMLFAVAPFLVLVAAGVMRLPGRVLRGVAAVLLVGYAARALWLQPPYPEAASLAAARLHMAGRVHAGDVMFHADTHAYLFGQRYYPLLRHRLLAMGQAVPYFEGRAVIPDSAFADASELRAASAAGTRWWALAWGRGQLDAVAFAACADSFADAPAESCGLARLWSSVRGR